MKYLRLFDNLFWVQQYRIKISDNFKVYIFNQFSFIAIIYIVQLLHIIVSIFL